MADVGDDLRELLRGLEVLGGPLPAFDPGEAPDDPTDLFAAWLVDAVEAGVAEPHAMTLSTVTPEGRPEARVLILKSVDRAGWRFAVSTAGAKGRDLAHSPYVALTFHWRELGRQVRVSGRAEAEEPERAAADFLARSASARELVLLGRQSEVLADPADIDRELGPVRDRLAAEPGLVPKEWTSYLVIADKVEFWQGAASRRHTRLRYSRATGTGPWRRDRLWP
ncbi:pyridoxal 5'-phosphate synthase [Streptomonospora nanhaiensis]|uniref:Pyridoxamine 5'-phosphate oxidase n=1 Tax=Streptomonospora nanhaiensis TaxID=1323731 RepID=A0A853BTG3_9ACTN|nr:pyridoxal 5'-phosphate synthase [Streptomonospora nanhaiensis]MBV2364561.1 pyridoxal 5'-phosphate synthase [Streptomonospora nanhaiensis]MBX9390186.1 pyridoxal 5'-phosphate synthase [Streptomonospora nanhaiensis]NYI99089.1 pyridoxamine 5'-phosphate oxidase [Streptomonospora nanhaiensis]